MKAMGRAGGFSLIELMVTVAIVGILTTLAVSSYRRYAMRANRTDAKATLLRIQVAQEKYFLQQNQYVNTLASVLALPPGGLGIGISAAGDTPGGYYRLSFGPAAPTATSYQITATAQAGQAQDTDCPTLSIDQSGQTLPAPPAKCW